MAQDNEQGGGETRSRSLDLKVREIIQIILRSTISLTSVRISCPDNVEADCLSHLQVKKYCQLERATEWSLDPRVTSLLLYIWGLPTVDLFATQLNNKGEGILLQPHRPSGIAGELTAGALRCQ